MPAAWNAFSCSSLAVAGASPQQDEARASNSLWQCLRPGHRFAGNPWTPFRVRSSSARNPDSQCGNPGPRTAKPPGHPPRSKTASRDPGIRIRRSRSCRAVRGRTVRCGDGRGACGLRKFHRPAIARSIELSSPRCRRGLGALLRTSIGSSEGRRLRRCSRKRCRAGLPVRRERRGPFHARQSDHWPAHGGPHPGFSEGGREIIRARRFHAACHSRPPLRPQPATSRPDPAATERHRP